MSRTVAKIVDDKIVYAVQKNMNKRFRTIIPQIKSEIKPKISNIILNQLNKSDTVQSLLSGKLKDDFGLFGNVAKVTLTNIIIEISEGIELNIESSQKSGSIITTTLDILPYSDFDKIISVAGGSFPSMGGNVDWLEWLLTRGTQVVIGDYWIFPYAKGKTRSGGNSIMKMIESKPRRPFRVDPNYAGTIEDNFITRAVESVRDDISKVLLEAVDRRF